MDSAKQQIVEKLQAANNILLTVSSSPSVDQLAACIGLTLLLNKLDKHATAVFSGQVPSTIDFLKPEATLEKNTDSLRDFIIALDKSKADKLRYKVEDKVVKIFITPYRTSLSSDDLEFSQGDFNVDVVLALGVKQQADLDEAITAHGRILHDATVISINNTQSDGELGSLNWQNNDASSLSELATQLATSFEKGDLLDGQIATALLTGIVAETDRFRNEKTTATTMSISAELMKAGANQQLVAKELEHEVNVRDKPSDELPDSGQKTAAEPAKPAADDGTLEIAHKAEAPTEAAEPPEEAAELPAPVEEPEPEISDIKVPEPSSQGLDAEGGAAAAALADNQDSQKDGHRSLITEPPTLGGTLTANTLPENGDLTNIGMPTSEPEEPLIERENRIEDDAQPAAASPPPPAPEPKPAPKPQPVAPPPSSTPAPKPEPAAPAAPTPPPIPVPTSSPMPPADAKPAPSPGEPPKPETLTELEEAVHSPHVDTSPAAPADDIDAVQRARDEVLKALNESSSDNLPPVQALNAQPLDLGKPEAAPEPPAGPSAPPVMPLPPNAPEPAPFSVSPADKPLDMPLPPATGLGQPPQPGLPQPPAIPAPGSPPSVPPPFMPGNFGK